MHPTRAVTTEIETRTESWSAHGGYATEESSQRGNASNLICVAACRDILVVDDNDRHLDILSTILRTVGHDVETCGSGPDALVRLEQRRYDLLVLDMVMPEVSGLVVASQMRAGVLNARTPIVACTANLVIARTQLADVPGIVAIIGKPINAALLVMTVAHVPERDWTADERRRAG